MLTKFNVEIIVVATADAIPALRIDIDQAIEDVIADYVSYGKAEDGFQLKIRQVV